MKRIRIQKIYRLERASDISEEQKDKNRRNTAFRRRVFQKKSRRSYAYGGAEFEERLRQIRKRAVTPIIIWN